MVTFKCNVVGCLSSACGVGGAIGLMAMGWDFQPGSLLRSPVLLCPNHHPQGVNFAAVQAGTAQRVIESQLR